MIHLYLSSYVSIKDINMVFPVAELADTFQCFMDVPTFVQNVHKIGCCFSLALF